MSWVSALFCLILLLYIWNGYRLGFIRTVFSVFTVIVSLIAAFAISPKLCTTLCKNEKIMQMVEKTVFLDEEAGEADTKPEQKKSIEDMELPAVIRNALKENNNDEIYGIFGAETFKEYIARYLSVMVVRILTCILTFIAVFVILHIVCALLDVASRLPVLDGLNKTAGALIGLVKGVLVVDIVMVSIFLFQNTAIGMSLMEQIMENSLLNWMFNHNFILHILMNLEEMFLQ